MLLTSFFWLIVLIKKGLFWIWLWQLKEYRIDRFLDHFRTEKGKKLFLNKLIFIKILFAFVLFILFILPSCFLYWSFLAQYLILGIAILTFFLYFIESLYSLINFLRKKIKIPVFTKKTVFLIFVTITFEVLFLLIFYIDISEVFLLSATSLIVFPFILLTFDILSPFIISLIVLFFQPLASFMKNQNIRKAKEKREKFKDLLVIGITGSYGKTSTKEFLATILEEKFKILKTRAHQNTDPGIAKCILENLNPTHQIFIVEMAAYKIGEIKSPCEMVSPKIGILTGINEQHLALFSSQENIIKAKYELIECLPEEGTAFFNSDNQYCLELYKKTGKPKRIYSQKKDVDGIKSDIWAENIKVEKDSVSFRAVSKDGDSADFKVNLLGAFNITNILGAVSCAKELGMSLTEISRACQKIKPMEGAMRLSKSKDGLNIIDAAYSANPNGVISHLEYLKIWPGKKLIIMPCLIELGAASIEAHKKIGEKIGQVCDLAIIATEERFKDIKKGAIKSGMPAENILFIENPRAIFEKIKAFAKAEDVVLLESRVPERLIVWLSK